MTIGVEARRSARRRRTDRRVWSLLTVWTQHLPTCLRRPLPPPLQHAVTLPLLPVHCVALHPLLRRGTTVPLDAREVGRRSRVGDRQASLAARQVPLLRSCV